MKLLFQIQRSLNIMHLDKGKPRSQYSIQNGEARRGAYTVQQCASLRRDKLAWTTPSGLPKRSYVKQFYQTTLGPQCLEPHLPHYHVSSKIILQQPYSHHSMSLHPFSTQCNYYNPSEGLTLRGKTASSGTSVPIPLYSLLS